MQVPRTTRTRDPTEKSRSPKPRLTRGAGFKPALLGSRTAHIRTAQGLWLDGEYAMLDRTTEEVGELRTNDGYIDTHLREPLVEENVFVRMPQEDVPPPSFEDAWDVLPRPFWEGHEGVIDCYRGTWELRSPTCAVLSRRAASSPAL